MLEITSALTDTGDKGASLEAVVARIHRLVAFDLCLVMHERDDDADKETVTYRCVSGPAACCALEETRTRTLLIDAHLGRLERIENSKTAFFWRSVVDNVPVHGVAGIVCSPETPLGLVRTMIQLQCSRDEPPARQLFFVNILGFYLHAYLLNASAKRMASGARAALSVKEQAVLEWIVGGKTCWEVGRILSMSERTVKFHLKNIYTKLNVVNRAQAAIKATRLRLV